MTYLDFMNGHFHFLTPSLAKKLPQITFFCQYLTFIGYFSLSLYVSEGKTVGKLFTGLKVVSKGNENPLSLFQCFLRALGSLLSTMLLMLPYFLILLKKDERGFHDLLGNSQTIEEDSLEEKEPIHLPDIAENQIKTAI